MEKREPQFVPGAAGGIGKAAAALALFAAVLLVAVSCGRLFFPRPVHLVGYRTFEAGSVAELRRQLDRAGLLDVRPGAAVAPVLPDRLPAGLKALPTAEKKRLFLAAILPVALVVREEIRRERDLVRQVLARTGLPPASVKFGGDGKNAPWRRGLDKDRLALLDRAAAKYRAATGADLLSRIGAVPVSVMLAQAAIESAWGTSRFALRGNNLFGIWTWDGDGLVPHRREAGKSHKVRVFPSIIEAAREYALILNSRPAYDEFRRLRRSGASPQRLAAGLRKYSERREDYVRDVRRVMRHNGLTGFDRCRLSL